METIYQNDIKTNLSHLQKLERVSNRELKLTNVTSDLISRRLGSKCKELTIDLFKYWEEYQKSVKDNLEVPENFVKNAKGNFLHVSKSFLSFKFDIEQVCSLKNFLEKFLDQNFSTDTKKLLAFLFSFKKLKKIVVIFYN